MKTNVHFLIISRSFLLRMRNVCDKRKSKHEFCVQYFFFRKSWRSCRVDTRWQYYSTHLHTDKPNNKTNNKRTIKITTNLEDCVPCPVFANLTLSFALQLREKQRKTSARVRKTWVMVRNPQSGHSIPIKKHPHITKRTHTHTHKHTPTLY